ncbi:hypothetical protein GCM10022269_03130 [Sphingorhabdus rigui]
MTTDMKKLEGLGKLLKAAGVKPAGAEAMVRDHIDEIQADARHHHAELIASVKALKEELVELQHNHASSVSEIRMATDLMRREIEMRSLAFGRTLRLAKFVLIIVVALQIILLVGLHTTTGSSLLDLGGFIPASNDVQARAPASVPAPAPTSSPQGAAAK